MFGCGNQVLLEVAEPRDGRTAVTCFAGPNRIVCLSRRNRGHSSDNILISFQVCRSRRTTRAKVCVQRLRESGVFLTPGPCSLCYFIVDFLFECLFTFCFILSIFKIFKFMFIVRLMGVTSVSEDDIGFRCTIPQGVVNLCS